MKAHCVYYGKGVLNLQVKRIIPRLLSGSVVIFSTGLAHWFLPVLAFTGKLPYSGASLNKYI